MIYEEPIAPTVEAIDEWRARQPESLKPGDPHFGVNVWTKAGSCRCVTSRVEHAGYVWYWTIRGEGSSNGGRDTAVRGDKVARAVGWIVANPDYLAAAGYEGGRA